MEKTKITYQVTFELEDIDKLRESYPNFKYNYTTFEEWAQSNIEYMLGMISDIEGYKVTVKKILMTKNETDTFKSRTPSAAKKS